MDPVGAGEGGTGQHSHRLGFTPQASGRRSPEPCSKPEKILKRGTYDKVGTGTVRGLWPGGAWMVRGLRPGGAGKVRGLQPGGAGTVGGYGQVGLGWLGTYDTAPGAGWGYDKMGLSCWRAPAWSCLGVAWVGRGKSPLSAPLPAGLH